MGGPGLVLMGRVAGAFGIRGEIKVFPFGRDPRAFARAGLMYVGSNPESTRVLTLAGLREHGGRLLITAPEVESREAAAKLGGQWVYLREADLDPLGEDEYYWYQLKGALVVDTGGNELGRVKEIADLGAHDLLLVRAVDGKEALIPVVEGVVLAINAKDGLVTVDPPPGLLEAQGWGAEPEGEEEDDKDGGPGPEQGAGA
jgi:16S rRNA processing protein RimM